MMLIDQDNTTRRHPRNSSPDATGIAVRTKMWGCSILCHISPSAQSIVYVVATTCSPSQPSFAPTSSNAASRRILLPEFAHRR